MDPLTIDQAAARLADPATPAAELAAIAAGHRALWPLIEQHPNAYPDLVDWMRQQAGTRPSAGPTAATSAGPAAVQTAEPVRFSVQPASPRSRRILPLVLTLSGIAAALAIALVVMLVVIPLGGGGLRDRLALVGAPAYDDYYRVTVTDVARLEDAMGAEFPLDGGSSAIERWVERAGSAEGPRINVIPAETLTAIDGLPYESEAFVSLVSESGDEASGDWEQEQLTALQGPFSEARLDRVFGARRGAVWEDASSGAWTVRDGNVYQASSAEQLPVGRHSREGSLASREGDVEVLARLAESGAYEYALTHRSKGLALFGTDEDGEWSEEPYFGEGGPVVTTWGSGLRLEHGSPMLTIVYLLASPSEAEANVHRLDAALKREADRAEIRSSWRITREGHLLVAEVELSESRDHRDLSRLAP